VDPAPLPAENYRDSTGALKREVAQFRIYGYDGAGIRPGEGHHRLAMVKRWHRRVWRPLRWAVADLMP
jgi:hypothetical protein